MMAREYPLFYSALSDLSTGPSERFIVDIAGTPLSLTEDMRIAVKTASITNAWNTISAAIGNHEFEYFNGFVTRLVTIPDSQKTVPEINQVLFNAMLAFGDHVGPPPSDITLSADFTTGRVTATISGGFALNLGNPVSAGFAALIGFTTGFFAVTTVGANRADVGNGISSLLIACSLAEGLLANQKTSRAMAQVAITSGPSTTITYTPPALTFMPVSIGTHTRVEVSLSDQLGRTFPDPNFSLNGEEFTVELTLLAPTGLK